MSIWNWLFGKSEPSDSRWIYVPPDEPGSNPYVGEQIPRYTQQPPRPTTPGPEIMAQFSSWDLHGAEPHSLLKPRQPIKARKALKTAKAKKKK